MQNDIYRKEAVAYMLILTRYLGDSIMIGDDIEIKFLKLNNDSSLSIGINAPRDLEIHRKEVYNLIQAKKIKASEEEKNVEMTELSDSKE